MTGQAGGGGGGEARPMTSVSGNCVIQNNETFQRHHQKIKNQYYYSHPSRKV